MASTSIGLQITNDRNTLTCMLAAIIENMSEEERIKIDRWLPLIEDYAEQIIHELKRKTVSQRRSDILAAASLYDAFLEFESRTSVRIRLPLLKETLGLKQCSINSAWTHLFDNRAILRKDYLNPVHNNGSLNYQEAAIAVLTNIYRAIIDKTTKLDAWIVEIRTLACKYLDTMDHTKAAEYDSVLVSTAAVYSALRNYPGKPRIQISQRDLAQFCNHSPAMLSKVWLELFTSS